MVISQVPNAKQSYFRCLHETRNTKRTPPAESRAAWKAKNPIYCAKNKTKWAKLASRSNWLTFRQLSSLFYFTGSTSTRVLIEILPPTQYETQALLKIHNFYNNKQGRHKERWRKRWSVKITLAALDQCRPRGTGHSLFLPANLPGCARTWPVHQAALLEWEERLTAIWSRSLVGPIAAVTVLLLRRVAVTTWTCCQYTLKATRALLPTISRTSHWSCLETWKATHRERANLKHNPARQEWKPPL